MSTDKRTAKNWWTLVKTAVAAWSDDYAPSMGAALSYYSVFSLGPLLLIVISVAGLVFGQDAVRGELFGQLRGMMGAEAAKGVEALLAGVSKPAQGAVATAIGIAVLLVGATTVFGELQDALDRIWRAPSRDKSSGLWGLLRARFLSFGMILGIAFLLMISLVLAAATSALGKLWGTAFDNWEVLAQLLNTVLGFAMTMGAFAMIYKLMPRVKVRWHDVWLGAAVTAALFTVGKFLIGLYVGKTGLASSFGAAGSLILIFVWVYYSAQIFLLGAEFTWVYARTFGSMEGVSLTVPSSPSAGGVESAAQADLPVPPMPIEPRGMSASAGVQPTRPTVSWREAGLLAGIGLLAWYGSPKLLRRNLAKRIKAAVLGQPRA